MIEEGGEGVAVSVTPTRDGAEVRICSPDAAGLGCDLARTMFDFGLCIDRGDFGTDGQWSFLMFKARLPRPLLAARATTLAPRRPDAQAPSLE